MTQQIIDVPLDGFNKLDDTIEDVRYRVLQLNSTKPSILHRPKRKMRQNKWLKENNIYYISGEEQIKRRSLFISLVIKTTFL